jgi:hypothetical protein
MAGKKPAEGKPQPTVSRRPALTIYDPRQFDLEVWLAEERERKAKVDQPTDTSIAHPEAA